MVEEEEMEEEGSVLELSLDILELWCRVEADGTTDRPAPLRCAQSDGISNLSFCAFREMENRS